MILLDNAIRHTPSGGRIRVAVAAARRPGAHRRPRRRGRGSPQSTFRTCSSGSTGPMERAAAPQAVQDWGWRSPRPFAGRTAAISVTSAPGQGATFLVALPGGAQTDASEHFSTQPAEANDGRTQVKSSGYSRSRINAAIAPPTSTTNAIGTTSPRMDSLRNPRP